jgi:glycosyltransferase A (GT-A) superfamily protein (DUF2064 family)
LTISVQKKQEIIGLETKGGYFLVALTTIEEDDN